MCEEDIIRYCAPTLAGMKTGSLFACRYPCKALLQKEVRSLNRRLVGKGLRVLPLSFKNNRALLYFFRPDMLKQSLRNSLACRLLEQRGYPCGNPDRCIRIPMVKDNRSLNLSNSVAVVLYEALRQQEFPGLEREGELHRLSWE